MKCYAFVFTSLTSKRFIDGISKFLAPVSLELNGDARAGSEWWLKKTKRGLQCFHN